MTNRQNIHLKSRKKTIVLFHLEKLFIVLSLKRNRKQMPISTSDNRYRFVFYNVMSASNFKQARPVIKVNVGSRIYFASFTKLSKPISVHVDVYSGR